MQSFSRSATPQIAQAETVRPMLRLHQGRLAPSVQVQPTLEPSPLHSMQTFATTMFVISVAACWLAVASTATAPLVAAGELLGRAARPSENL